MPSYPGYVAFLWLKEEGWRPDFLRTTVMKEGIHPEYREVVFLDQQTGNKFISRSTLQSRETIELDGKTYPLFKCDVTSESHPFYTGAQTRIVETGRVEKFRARFARTAGTRKAS
jgi:large subunit ribosomal protein L31